MRLQPLQTPSSPPAAGWVDSMRNYLARYLVGEPHEQTATFDAFRRDVVDQGWVDLTFEGFLLWQDYNGLSTSDKQWIPYPDVLGVVLARQTKVRVDAGADVADRATAMVDGIQDWKRNPGWPQEAIDLVVQHYRIALHNLTLSEALELTEEEVQLAEDIELGRQIAAALAQNDYGEIGFLVRRD